MLSGPNSGTTVFPRNTNPAARSFAITASSCSGTRSRHSAVPWVLHDPRSVGEVLDGDRNAEKSRVLTRATGAPGVCVGGRGARDGRPQP